jgi:hypothetical protein
MITIDNLQSQLTELKERGELPLLLHVAEVPRIDHDGFITIGDDYGTELRVRMSDGAVYSIDPEGKLPTRFVNSSIKQLGECVDAFQLYLQAATIGDDTSELAQTLRSAVARIDEPALNNPQNWWSCIAEQVDDGLL